MQKMIVASTIKTMIIPKIARREDTAILSFASTRMISLTFIVLRAGFILSSSDLDRVLWSDCAGLANSDASQLRQTLAAITQARIVDMSMFVKEKRDFSDCMLRTYSDAGPARLA